MTIDEGIGHGEIEISIEDRKLITELMFGSEHVQRFTRDSPVLPDVWMTYFAQPARTHDLLLTPRRKASPGKVAKALRDHLRGSDG